MADEGSESRGARLAAFSVDTERPFAGADDGTFRYLELFERLSLPATFFIVGEVAERRPDIVDAIHLAGHEIACHAWQHPNIGQRAEARDPFVDELNDADFSDSLCRCHQVLTRGGQPPRGFRAPWFRISEANLAVLKRYFSYDSSLTAHKLARTSMPPGLSELPVSTLGRQGPRLGTSFLFGPGARRVTLAALRVLAPAEPLMMFGHSFDLSGCPRGLHTARWKRAWYFDRCGPQQTNVLADMLTALRDRGYRFVRCGELVGGAAACTGDSS